MVPVNYYGLQVMLNFNFLAQQPEFCFRGNEHTLNSKINLECPAAYITRKVREKRT
jgi:hypothetical protein